MGHLVNVVIPPLPQAYTYDLPGELESVADVGSQVEVPLGNRKATGFVVSKFHEDQVETPERKFKLKPVSSCLLDYPSFIPEQLTFFQWIADYYRSSLGAVIDAAVPAASPPKFSRIIRLNNSEAKPKGKIQKEILSILNQQGGEISLSELQKRLKNPWPAVKRLSEGEIVSVTSQELFKPGLSKEPMAAWAKATVDLNEPQKKAVTKIGECVDAKTFETFLLHGVTGSGKTEVYLEVIQKVLAQGGGVLVVVPEIALTPQLVDRFRARLGDEIAVLHSALSRRSRWESWRALLENRFQIAIGARSAIFAPVQNLQLIVVDEEHDSSFKQSDGLRYNARDLAVLRGKMATCPVILGSATPSLESFHRAGTKKYQFLSLPNRHETGSSLSIDIVDFNKIAPWDMKSKNITPALHSAIEKALADGSQSFVLYNRRGFASYLQCEECQTAVECPNCSVTLTYHQGKHSLQCHYCNLSMHPPEFCSGCTASKKTSAAGTAIPGKLVPRGAGTEKVVDELAELFPNAVIDRLDRDTATNIAHYQNILDRIRSGESQILVGTQMIAKGHDLPDVTVVGIVDCDVGLHMPDFRAAERVFQLLTQASGRAGRGDKKGKVILQTRVPEHAALQATQEQSYINFAKRELLSRKLLRYPPYGRMLRIVASSADKALPPSILASFKSIINQVIQKENYELELLGPTSAPLEKLKTHWRWHLMIKGQRSSELNHIMGVLKSVKLPSRKLRVTFDLDPQDML
jgi:primosomal protein N' (replication factor Y)